MMSSIRTAPSLWGLFLCLLICSGCSPASHILEPKFVYAPQANYIANMPSPFKPLTAEERKQEWGREMIIGTAFAKEMDLYRAITAYKRALFLLDLAIEDGKSRMIPGANEERKTQIQYHLIACYYLGNKYWDALTVFETSPLYFAPVSFPALDDLLLIIYDCYIITCQEEKAALALKLIEYRKPEKARDIPLAEAFFEGNLCGISQAAEQHPKQENLQCFLDTYRLESKSVGEAQMRNAILPGAGYYYVGQKKAALTSFLINALFIAAAYEFFDRGYWAAGAITTSLECGWYFGGINGAGLAAKEYNERLFEVEAKPMMLQNRLFPVLRLEYGF